MAILTITKNNKKYEYGVPYLYPIIDYNLLIDKLSDLDIETTRFSCKFCRIFTSKNRNILNELKSFFKDVSYEMSDEFNIYEVKLLSDEYFSNILKNGI